MAGFLSSSALAEVNSTIDTLHTTFARPIVVYKTAKETIVSTNPNFNPIYNKATSSVTYTERSETIQARIYYLKTSEEILDSEGNKTAIPAGSVKITVPSANKNYLEEGKRVVFDDKPFSIISDGKPSNFWSKRYYSFWLLPLEE